VLRRQRLFGIVGKFDYGFKFASKIDGLEGKKPALFALLNEYSQVRQALIP